MNIDPRIIKARHGLDGGKQLFLHLSGNGDDAASIADVDDHVNDDRIVLEGDLHALGGGLDPDQLGQFGAGGVGKAGNAFDLGDRAFDETDDHVLGNMDTALFLLAGDIIFSYGKTS